MIRGSLAWVAVALLVGCGAKGGGSGGGGGANGSGGSTSASTGASAGGGQSGDASSASSHAGGSSASMSSNGGSGGAGAGGPMVFHAFDGDTGQPGASCGGSPGCLYKDHPDMGVAANGTQVVEVTGQYVTVFDYGGNVLKKTAFPMFINGAGLVAGTINDPRITYDPFISRWIVTCSCSNDFLIVSAGSNAMGAWKGVALGVGSGDLTMFPGWDRHGVYVTEYEGNTSNYAAIAILGTDVAWSSGGNISLMSEKVFANFPWETRPATDPDPNKPAGGPAYFLARSGPLQNGTNVAFDLLVDSVSWSGGVASKGTQHQIPSGYLYNTPISVAQPSGAPLRATESHRFFSVAAQGTHLHGVVGSGPCTSSCGAQGTDTQQLFYWFDVDTSSMTLAESAKVSSASDGYLFPSLAVDGSGDVGITATAAGASTDASVVLFSRRFGDPSGQLTGPMTLTAGTKVYACDAGNPVGWGDYAASVQDPSDPTRLWAVAEYANSATACQWQTRLIQYRP